jgi:hypothetical protein
MTGKKENIRLSTIPRVGAPSARVGPEVRGNYPPPIEFAAAFVLCDIIPKIFFPDFVTRGQLL